MRSQNVAYSSGAPKFFDSARNNLTRVAIDFDSIQGRWVMLQHKRSPSHMLARHKEAR